MARLGLLIWTGCVKERLLKTLLLLWTVFLLQGQELLCVECLCLCLGFLCCAQLCWGWGYSEYITSFQEQLGSLFSIPILVRIASGIRVLACISGVPRNVASTAVLGMMLPFWLGVHLCPSPIPSVLHCFLPTRKAPVSFFSIMLLYSTLCIKAV